MLASAPLLNQDAPQVSLLPEICWPPWPLYNTDEGQQAEYVYLPNMTIRVDSHIIRLINPLRAC